MGLQILLFVAKCHSRKADPYELTKLLKKWWCGERKFYYLSFNLFRNPYRLLYINYNIYCRGRNHIKENCFKLKRREQPAQLMQLKKNVLPSIVASISEPPENSEDTSVRRYRQHQKNCN